jgi:hypothetical protein
LLHLIKPPFSLLFKFYSRLNDADESPENQGLLEESRMEKHTAKPNPVQQLDIARV